MDLFAQNRGESFDYGDSRARFLVLGRADDDEHLLQLAASLANFEIKTRSERLDRARDFLTQHDEVLGFGNQLARRRRARRAAVFTAVFGELDQRLRRRCRERTQGARGANALRVHQHRTGVNLEDGLQVDRLRVARELLDLRAQQRVENFFVIDNVVRILAHDPSHGLERSGHGLVDVGLLEQ